MFDHRKRPGPTRRKWVWRTIALSASAVVAWLPAGNVRAQTPIRDPQHIFQQHVCSWQEIKRENIVMQKRDYSCGAATLATIARYFWGDNVGEGEFLHTIDRLLTPAEMLDREKNGLSLTDMRRAAVKLGYFSTIGTLQPHELYGSKVPLIVPIKIGKHDHFVVYRGTDGVWVYLADPIRGNVRTTVCDFECQWQKNAVLILAKPDRDPPKVSPLSVDPCESYLGEMSLQVVRTRSEKFTPLYGPLIR